MPKFRVNGVVTVSVHTEVEADSVAEAIAKAEEQPLQSFCHQCSRGNPDDEWVTSGELDGAVTDIEAEETD